MIRIRCDNRLDSSLECSYSTTSLYYHTPTIGIPYQGPTVRVGRMPAIVDTHLVIERSDRYGIIPSIFFDSIVWNNWSELVPLCTQSLSFEINTEDARIVFPDAAYCVFDLVRPVTCRDKSACCGAEEHVVPPDLVNRLRRFLEQEFTPTSYPNLKHVEVSTTFTKATKDHGLTTSGKRLVLCSVDCSPSSPVV